MNNGGSPMSPNIARKVIDSFLPSAPTNDAPTPHKLPLTDREYELLTVLAEGLLYKEIAEKTRYNHWNCKATHP